MASLRQRGKSKTWQVRWRDERGKDREKSFGPGEEARRAAAKFKKEVEAEKRLGLMTSTEGVTWDDFKAKFLSRHFRKSEEDGANRTEIDRTLRHFERHTSPRLVENDFTLDRIEHFRVQRQDDAGRNTDFLSPATVNKDLRNLRIAHGYALRWHPAMKGDIDWERLMLREDEHEAPWLKLAEFQELVKHAGVATMPHGDPEYRRQWWQGFLWFLVMTGWRCSQALALKTKDVDLDRCEVFVKARRTKGRRDERHKFHECLKPWLQPLLDAGHEHVFPWKQWGHQPRSLYYPIKAIQEAAGVMPDYDDDNDYQPTYGFHVLRYTFATWNAGSLDLFALQTLMQHRSLATTRRYAAMSEDRRTVSVDKLVVPGGV